jgi:DMSO/TMAO reductase YedYZ molybdopterin-dependent catalytic subunit
VIPRLYAWKSAKWVKGIELIDRDQAGFWEQNGFTCVATRRPKSGLVS